MNKMTENEALLYFDYCLCQLVIMQQQSRGLKCDFLLSSLVFQQESRPIECNFKLHPSVPRRVQRELARFTLGLQTELGFQAEKPGFTCTVCAQSESKPREIGGGSLTWRWCDITSPKCSMTVIGNSPSQPRR